MSLSLVGIFDAVVRFYTMLVFVYVILSWFPASRALADLRRVLGTLCEPYIGLFRRLIPSLGVGGAGVDFSPLIAIVVLQYGYSYLIRPLLSGL